MQWINGFPLTLRPRTTFLPRFNFHFIKSREAYLYIRVHRDREQTPTYVYRRPETWEQYMKPIGTLGLYIRFNANGQIFRRIHLKNPVFFMGPTARSDETTACRGSHLGTIIYQDLNRVKGGRERSMKRTGGCPQEFIDAIRRSTYGPLVVSWLGLLAPIHPPIGQPGACSDWKKEENREARMGFEKNCASGGVWGVKCLNVITPPGKGDSGDEEECLLFAFLGTNS